MRNLILCEGFDDVLILGYYLYKTQKWVFDPKAIFSNFYKFPKIDVKRQVVEVYKKNDDLVGIWAVGGKDSFEAAFTFIYKVNSRYPQQGINKVFIVTDRDNCAIENSLEILKEKMKNCGIEIQELYNNQENLYSYEVEEEMFDLSIIPVIVPFDQVGALETVLLQGIAETGAEEQFIVEYANKYITDILDSGRLHTYLKHERLILKARLSAVISITNPDRSAALFDRVLMSWNWEEKNAVRKHFETITKYLEI